MTTTTTPDRIAGRRPWWQTASWIGLLVLAGFTIFGAVNDLIADAGTGLPVDHTHTFASIAGTSWTNARHADAGIASYVTLLERGYALHELVYGILFVIILAIPFRRRQRWAWFAAWTPTIANLGYALTFGVHDTAISYRALIVVVPLPVLLLIQAPAFFGRSTRRGAGAGVDQPV